MEHENVITALTEDEIWQEVNKQFQQEPELLSYRAVLVQDNRKVLLDIDIDLGGGFESGYETTTFVSHLHSEPPFRFAIHEQHFTDEIGKFFGMQDVEIGYEDFDEKLIIKTNNAEKVRQIFSDPSVRQTFLSLSDFSFGTTTQHSSHPEKDGPFLELTIENGITDPQKLREIYHAFYAVLMQIDPI